MKIFGLEIRRSAKALSPVNDWRQGWRVISESYAGAWQKNDEIKRGELTVYPTLFACLSRISQDIGKLKFMLVKRDARGLWSVTESARYSHVLNRPNSYQTAAQFREAWILAKLQYGNAYVLKVRDIHHGLVDTLHVLDSTCVTPMVSESGHVFYQISYGSPNNLLPSSYPAGQVTVPASEIIHDREPALFHPLIGIPPLAAAALAAGKNHHILTTESSFFANGARPAGILTAPAGLSDDDAAKIIENWQRNYTGTNAGKLAVVGADLKYQSFNVSGRDSQLVEQLRFSDEQIAAAFGIPAFLVGAGPLPSGLQADDLADLFHRHALQARIEAMEDCLDEGLGLSDDIGVELDLDPLLRMNPERAATVESALVGAGIKSPNEARRRFNLPPVEGGDSPLMQQQNYSLAALARRDEGADPFGTGRQETPDKAYERSLDPNMRMLKKMAEEANYRRSGIRTQMRWSEGEGKWIAE